MPLENSSLSSSTLPSKTYRTFFWKFAKNDKCVCFNEVIWLIKMKKKKRKLDDIDMTKINLGLDMDTDILSIKKRLSMIMLICIKQHLSNI